MFYYKLKHGVNLYQSYNYYKDSLRVSIYGKINYICNYILLYKKNKTQSEYIIYLEIYKINYIFHLDLFKIFNEISQG